jgi:Fe2+ transport system protein FeoA
MYRNFFRSLESFGTTRGNAADVMKPTFWREAVSLASSRRWLQRLLSFGMAPYSLVNIQPGYTVPSQKTEKLSPQNADVVKPTFWGEAVSLASSRRWLQRLLSFGMAPYSLVNIQRFREHGAMERASSSETSVNIYYTTQHYISKDSNLHSPVFKILVISLATSSSEEVLLRESLTS